MPFALLLMGMLAFVSAYRNTLPQLGALLKGDFSGNANFLYWFAAIVIIGTLGYAKPFHNSSRMLILLVLVVMILSDKGFFTKFVEALNQPAPPAAAAATGNAPDTGGTAAASAAGKSTGGLAGSIIGDVAGAIGGGDGGLGGAAADLIGGLL